MNFKHRKNQVGTLTSKVGVYILCDLENVPVYVGQSRDGIRARVQRHLTSARSDIIANRQLDVWEIAYVWAYPVENKAEIGGLEARLFHFFNPKSQLMTGKIPQSIGELTAIPEPSQVVQVMEEEDRIEKLKVEQRLPRKAKQYADIVSHFLAVKNSDEISRAMDAHFVRLKKYHELMVNLAAK